jgi:uncharacterized membrane protein YdjX (TVP38/TMEM64 family)
LPDVARGERRSVYVKLAALVIIITVALLGFRTLGLSRYTDAATLSSLVRGLRDRPHIGILFVGAYALATTLALPGSVLTIAGGAIFGFGKGTLLNWLGATIGATLAYLLASSLGLDAVRRLLGRRAERLDQLAGAHGFATVLRLRLIPAVPFNVLNFAAGLAGVPLRDYLLGTVLGLLPATAVYTYFADALLSGVAGARRDAFVRLLIAGLLLVALSFLPALLKGFSARRKASLAVVASLTLVSFDPLLAQRAVVDHAPFDALLKRYVVRGLVDYDGFARAPAFKRYLTSLNGADPSALPERERLAFWLNVYNAYTIELIIEHHERESIRNINRSLGFLKLKGPWSERIVQAGGRALTLDQVEHDIVRKEFKEPRIHFALVCAALGCPPLRNEAYSGDRLDAQLEDQGRTFILASPTKNHVDVDARTAFVSLVFTLYKSDFGGSDAALGRYLARWYPDGAARRLLESGAFRVEQTSYDWALNSQEHAR